MNIAEVRKKGETNVQYGGPTPEGVLRHREPSGSWKMRSYLWHLLQMVLAMEAGMVIYHLLEATVLASTGYAVLVKEYRLVDYWVMVLFMALGMTAFMRYRSSTWRHCLRMTLAMLAPVAPLSVLAGLGVLSVSTVHWLGDLTMILAMAVYLYYRPGEHAHSAHEPLATHQHATLDPTAHADMLA